MGFVCCHLWQHDIYCNLLLLLLLAAYTGGHWLFMKKFENPGSSRGLFFISKLFFIPAGVSFVPQHLLFSFPSASVPRGSWGTAHNRAHARRERGRAGGKEPATRAGLRWLCFQQSVGRKGKEIQISIYRHQNPALSILQKEGKQRLGYPQSTTSMLTKRYAKSCGLSVH